jgi:hypothetical protein
MPFFFPFGASLSLQAVLREAESGSHSPLGDRKARFSGGEGANLRHRRIPGCYTCLRHSKSVPFFFFFVFAKNRVFLCFSLISGGFSFRNRWLRKL